MSVFRFLAGVLSGTALGLLFAKQEGKKLRKKLEGKNSKEIAEILGKEFLSAGKDAKKTVEDIMQTEEVQELIKKGKIEAQDFAEKAQIVIDEQMGKATKTVKKAAPKAKKAVKATTKKATKTVKNTVKKAAKTVKKAIK